MRRNKIAFFLTAGLLMLTSFPSYAAQDEFPEGMTQAEKNQLLNEMYQDIGSDENIEITPNASDFSSMTDEEYEKLIKDSLPTEEELNTVMESMEGQVIQLASYKDSYDKKDKLYKYSFSKGGSVLTSVPLGAITNYAVAIETTGGAQILEITRNGASVAALADSSGNYFFRETGEYSFLASGGSARESYISGSFKIIGNDTPIRDSFVWSPEGYYLSEVVHSGQVQKPSEGRYFSFLEDGFYELNYEPKSELKNVLPPYSVTFVRDTTAPVLEWEGEVVDGRFAGTVTYSYKEQDTIVEILYNGQKAVSENHVLAAAGNYYITASDRVGNTRTYSFTIIRKGQIPWKIVGLVLLGFLIIGLLIIYFSRFTMKVQQDFKK